MKNGKMIFNFISDPKASFYASSVFTEILKFVQRQVIPCKMSEKNGKLTLAFSGVDSIGRVSEITDRMKEFVYQE